MYIALKITTYPLRQERHVTASDKADCAPLERPGFKL
jgi:hypothetical protein